MMLSVFMLVAYIVDRLVITRWEVPGMFYALVVLVMIHLENACIRDSLERLIHHNDTDRTAPGN